MGAVSDIWRVEMNKFLKDQSGATAVEYGLIAAALALCLVTIMPLLTDALTTKFGQVDATLK